jgi:hypothetical protein
MFRWIHATSLVITAIALFGFVAGPGCQPPKGKDSNTPKEKEKDKDKEKHDHGEYGPHGGALADWDDKYHGEVTPDTANKMVIVYILDDKAKKAPDLEASRISKLKLVIAAEKVDLDLTHDAKKSGPEGIVYTGAHDFFANAKAFKGNLSMVVDEGKKGAEKRFTDEFDYDPKKAAPEKKK